MTKAAFESELAVRFSWMGEGFRETFCARFPPPLGKKNPHGSGGEGAMGAKLFLEVLKKIVPDPPATADPLLFSGPPATTALRWFSRYRVVQEI